MNADTIRVVARNNAEPDRIPILDPIEMTLAPIDGGWAHLAFFEGDWRCHAEISDVASFDHTDCWVIAFKIMRKMVYRPPDTNDYHGRLRSAIGTAITAWRDARQIAGTAS